MMEKIVKNARLNIGIYKMLQMILISTRLNGVILIVLTLCLKILQVRYVLSVILLVLIVMGLIVIIVHNVLLINFYLKTNV